jgi:hypothetical protein
VRAGAFTTASPSCWVVRRVRKTAFYFIRSATTEFTPSGFPYRSRISLQEAFAGLELYARRLACTVLRGPGPSNGAGSSKSRRQLSTQRSAAPFCHRLRKAVRVG